MGRASRHKKGRFTDAERQKLARSIRRKITDLLGEDAVAEMVLLNTQTTAIGVDGVVHLCWTLDDPDLAPLVCGVPFCGFVDTTGPPNDIVGDLAEQPDVNCARCMDTEQIRFAMEQWRLFAHWASRRAEG